MAEAREPTHLGGMMGASLVVVLVGLAFVALALAVIGPNDAFDFRNAYLSGAQNVAQGNSPYPPAGDVLIERDRAYVYPPTLAVLLVPLTLMPQWLAVLLWTSLGIATIGSTLWLVGVRDARVYAVAYMWAPVYTAVQNGNASLVVMLLTALVWRFRDRALAAGLAAGLAIALKLFVWPLIVWLLVTRRFRAAGFAAGSAVAFLVGSWALIGFEGVSRYRALIDELTRTAIGLSHSITSVSVELGFSRTVGTAVSLLVGGTLLLACLRAGRRNDEVGALALALAAGLAIVPILWQHHLLVLLVPLAIARPRLSWVWFAFVPTWVCFLGGYGELWQQALVFTATAIVIASCVTSPLRWARSREPVPVHP